MCVLAGATGFLVQLLAGWPGWLAPDSLTTWSHVQSGTFADAPASLLTWMWSLLHPASAGPLGPFLLQLQFFWIGVTLLSIGLQPAARWTRFLPLLMLVNPAVWAVVVVSRDSAVLCGLMLACGVASLSARAFRRGDGTGGTVALLCAAVVVGLCAIGRASSVPGLLLLTAVLGALVVPRWHGTRARLEAIAKSLVLTLVAGLVVLVSLPMMLLGEVGGGRSAEGVYALDAYHIDCADFWSSRAPSTAPVSPPQLWQGGVAPCATGGPGDYGSAWMGSIDPAGEPVLSFSTWFGWLLDHPAVVIGGRIQHGASVLASSYTAAPDVSGHRLIAAEGGVGSGTSAGAPNRGGIVLSAHAALTSFLPQQLLVWSLLIPVASVLWLRRRNAARQQASPPRRIWILALWPGMWAVAMAGLVPGHDTSAVAPAAVLGWAVALWLLGMGGQPPAPPVRSQPQVASLAYPLGHQLARPRQARGAFLVQPRLALAWGWRHRGRHGATEWSRPATDPMRNRSLAEFLAEQGLDPVVHADIGTHRGDEQGVATADHAGVGTDGSDEQGLDPAVHAGVGSDRSDAQGLDPAVHAGVGTDRSGAQDPAVHPDIETRRSEGQGLDPAIHAAIETHRSDEQDPQPTHPSA